MGRSNRFVKPKAVRIDISDGDWIEIKEELTVGERKRMYADAFEYSMNFSIGKKGQKEQTGEVDEASLKMDGIAIAFAKVNTYLLDWSLAEPDLDGEGKPKLDEDGNQILLPVKYSPEALQNLDQATFDEIEAAIDKHEEALEARKKAIGGGG